MKPIIFFLLFFVFAIEAKSQDGIKLPGFLVTPLSGAHPTLDEKGLSFMSRPGSGRLMVQYTLSENAPVSIELLDAYGMLLQEIKVNTVSPTVGIDFGERTAGIYQYRYLVGGEQRAAGRIEWSPMR